MAKIQGPGELDLTGLVDQVILPLPVPPPVPPAGSEYVPSNGLLGQPLRGAGSSESIFEVAEPINPTPLPEVPPANSRYVPGSGQPYLMPGDLNYPLGQGSTEMPLPEGATAQVTGQTTDLQPPGLVKVGEDTTTTKSTSTSTVEKTKEAEKAEKDLLESRDQYEKAALEKQRALDAEANAQAELDKADQMAIAVAEASRADARAEGLAKVQRDLADIDQKVAELTNFKPETFWGSKSASDKIAASISVGLGGFGQALLGSGQNVGQMLLQRQMDEFDRNTQNLYQRQIAQINGMRSSLETKMQLVDEAEKIFDARKLAARAQVQAELGKALTLAKTGPVKAQLGMQIAEFDKQIANTRLDNEAKYARRVTSNETENTVVRTSTANQLMGVKERSERIDELGKTQTKLAPIRSEIASALKLLQNPRASREDKIRVGQGLVKTLNSTQGADAVGVEEAERLARELETSFGALGKAATGGAAAGATGGAALAGIPSLGFGAPLGAAVGAVLGAVGGSSYAAFDEMSKPGGVRFSPDIEGFTNRVQGALQKIDGTLERQSRLQELVKRGLTIPQANRIIDQEAGL